MQPNEECPDPLYGLREYSVAFASAFLPVTPELYLALAGSKLAAVAKPSGDPRPVGIRGVFDRIGQRTLLQADGVAIAQHFASQNEFGSGVQGVTQILGWLFKMHREKHPGAIQF